MKSGDITGVTGVPELTWCYNRNKHNVIMSNHDTYPDELGSKPSHTAVLAVDPSSSDSFK